MRSKIYSALMMTTAFAMCDEAALAQQSPADQSQTTAPAAQGIPSTADIVVTARRRSERLVDVPISITALSGSSLASKGITSVQDLQNETPGLKMEPSSGRAANQQYELRGIATLDSYITEDPAIGVYVNDVYRGHATGTNQSLFDINNIQVLYGPQGTLFGRNSTGGAILINSNHPTDRFEGSLQTGYGNFNRFEATAVLNLPLSDKLSVRLAGQHVQDDGYATNVTDGSKLGGTDSYSGRISIDWKPFYGVDNLLIGTLYTANNQATPQVLYGYRSSTTPNQFGQVPVLPLYGFNPLMLAILANQQAVGPYNESLDGPGATIPVAGGKPISLVGRTGYLLQGSVLTNANGYENPRNRSISDITTIELNDHLMLKNIFGYNYTALESSEDLDGTPLDLIDNYYKTTANQVSDEVQLQGHTDKLTWVVGGMYFREKGHDINDSIQLIAAFGDSEIIGVNTSFGVFSQGTYKITDKLSFTAGGRYTFDSRDADYNKSVGGSVGSSLANNGGLGIDLDTKAKCALPAGVANDGACGYTAHASFKQPSYAVSLDYKPTSDMLLYITSRHGYRSGGFNPRLTLSGATAADILSQVKPFKPEMVTDIEAGFKGTLRVGQMNVRPGIAVYKSFYTDILKQVTNFIAGSSVTDLTNAGNAHVTGLESSLGIRFAKGVDFDSYFSVVNGHYINFPSPDARQPAGTVVPYVPFTTAKNTAGATLTLTPIDNPDTGQVRFAANYSYRSSYYGDNSLPAISEEAHLPSQYNVNLTLNWENIAGSKFSAGAWVKNLTNKVHYLGELDIVPAFGGAFATVGAPRTYGFTVKYVFGR